MLALGEVYQDARMDDGPRAELQLLLQDMGFFDGYRVVPIGTAAAYPNKMLNVDYIGVSNVPKSKLKGVVFMHNKPRVWFGSAA